MSKVIIVGGGIIGQFTAFFLAKNGHEVSVIDDQPSMTPASEGNCGLITPGHILPLNSVSALIQGIKWIGKKDAPLSIKPQLNRTFIAWFINFIKYSSSSSVKKATKARYELLQLSFNLYEDFFNNEHTTAEWNKGGLLYAAKSESSLAHLEQEVKIQETYGMKSRIVSKSEIHAEESNLKDDIVGGAIMEMDGWLNPSQLLKDIREINLKNGVRYIHSKVSGFNLNGSNKISHAITSNEEFSADEFCFSHRSSGTFTSEKAWNKITHHSR